MASKSSETIAAISSAIGEGGVGVIRISGADALSIFGSIFTKKSQFRPNYCYHGWIINPGTGEHVDEVMAVYFKAPKSFTGEDVIEISCHGGPFVMNHILDIIIDLGAGLAVRGEFTKKAFLNGRIDLAQAESVIDIIKSQSLPSLMMSTSNLRGLLSQKIASLRKKIVYLLAKIEANIDFEEDVGSLDTSALNDDVSGCIFEIRKLIEKADAGIIYRNGLNIAIVGKPNVGKSSLLNAILRYERAIVTNEPGTTRDIIEESVNIRGVAAKIIDTAGIGTVSSEAEKIGVDLAIRAIERADLILLVLDLSAALSREDNEILGITNGKKRIIILNKSDLSSGEINLKKNKDPVVNTVAICGIGIDELEKAVLNSVGVDKLAPKDMPNITRMRHKEALQRALSYLFSVKDTINDYSKLDLVSIDLKNAIIELGEITGEEVSEEIINRIFDEFCVGK